jgi:hypothetical protein
VTKQISRGGRLLFKWNIVAKWLRGVLNHQQQFAQNDSSRNYLPVTSLSPHEARHIVQGVPLVTMILHITTIGLRPEHCCRQ